MRITAGAYAWRKVEKVLGDRRMSCKLKGNVLSSCVTPTYLNAVDIITPTEKQQEKIQV